MRGSGHSRSCQAAGRAICKGGGSRPAPFCSFADTAAKTNAVLGLAGRGGSSAPPQPTHREKVKVVKAGDQVVRRALDARQRLALRVMLDYERGFGAEPKPEIRERAEEAAAICWKKATPNQRRLLFGDGEGTFKTLVATLREWGVI